MSWMDYFTGSNSGGSTANVATSTTSSTTTASNLAGIDMLRAQQAQHMYYAQQIASAQQNSLANSALGGYVSSAASTAPQPGVWYNPVQRTYKPHISQFTALTEEDLANPAFDTPLDTLVNLWLARYGDIWVDKANVIGDTFFEITAQRLLQLGHMEQHTVCETGGSFPYKVVLRIIS
jgi:hypothetical protein